MSNTSGNADDKFSLETVSSVTTNSSNISNKPSTFLWLSLYTWCWIFLCLIICVAIAVGIWWFVTQYNVISNNVFYTSEAEQQQSSSVSTTCNNGVCTSLVCNNGNCMVSGTTVSTNPETENKSVETFNNMVF